ncbi:peptidoglycan-binding domain-containing protein [Pseudaestuariivita atlantica]|uniref:Caspase family p20 domain-containing protein n=1 Tax=Pseudaestuariivita atlantica TaxID=1317121 RepID=A0A0L1JRZ4_9RHOB|nr:peptidoglycan-binding domain-containing protein [Pseudaestuariivita atlantica]KNG94520.1 hypothetical protein ATO11_03615 [Pseudaestuariivita atlantica]
MKQILYAAVAALSLVVAPVVQAQERDGENLALIIGNFDYEVMEDVSGTQEADRIGGALRNAGFQVIRGLDLTNDRQVGMARIFAERLRDADRVMVVVMGHVVSSDDDSFLLGVDARETDVLNAGLNGLSLTAVQSLLEQRPGTAILMVAGNRTKPDLGRGMRDGFGATPIKQGVTVVRGRADALSKVVIDGLLEPGNSLRQALPSRSGLNVSGFVSDRVSFMGAGKGDEVSPELGQLAYWNATRDIGTKEAYEAYLRRFPQGIFAQEAQSSLEELRLAPLRAAQAAEVDLGMDRPTRRAVQAALTQLGYNTRGVDGIFGNGSRAAIKAWQEANNFDQTGYLTRPQLVVLQRQKQEADAAAEREAEAAREAEERRAEEARQNEQKAWERARELDNLRGYRQFVRDFPDGRYAGEARRRITAIRQANQQNEQSQQEQEQENEGSSFDNSAAAAQERIFAPNRVIRLAIERQLARNGFNPGAVDGEITQRTRRAIAAFQNSRGLPVTGYVDAATVSLLAL